MMDSTVISSLISAAVTLAICLITTNAQHKKTQALIEYRLDALTKEVEKHNHVVEKMAVVEVKLADIKGDVDALFPRVRDLEGNVK